MEITQEEFENYISIQKSGITNMMDVRNVMALTDLSKEKILYIMGNYGKLSEKYK